MQIILAILKSKILSTLSGSQENNFDVRSKWQCSFHNGGLKVYDFNFSLRRSASTAAAGVSGALPTSAGGRFEEIEQDMPSSTTQEPSVAIASSAGNLFANHIFFARCSVIFSTFAP